VDMSLNGGNGDVVVSSKNTQLIAPTCEKLAAVLHSNGKDVWVMTVENNSNNFYAYLVTSTGVSLPVVTSIGATYSGGTNPRAYLKFSPNGQKLFSIFGWATGAATLFDFNATTGIVSNPQVLDAAIYGTSFSPNSQVLYANYNTGGGDVIYQYDISSGIAATIIASKTTIATIPSGLHRAFQLGKDGKMYIAYFAGTTLSVINNPNVLGAGCNFVQGGFSMGTKIAMLGLPNFIENYFDPNYSSPTCAMTLSTTPSGCLTPCTGTATAAMIGGTGPFGYSWNSTPLQNVQTATGLCGGNYTVTITDSSNNSTSTSIVTVSQTPGPTVTLGTPPSLTCIASSVALSVIANPNTVTYSWTGNSIVSGGTTSSPTVNAVGNYTVTVTDTITGCTATASVLVNLNNTPPNVSTVSPVSFNCITGTTGTISVTSSTPGVSYSWSGPGVVSGGTSNIPSINAPGTYTVVVTNPANGCTATGTVLVTTFTQQPNVSGSTGITLNCITTSGTITANSTTSGVNYSWTGPGVVSGTNTSTPTVNAGGTYTVTVTATNGCTKTATVLVTNNNTPPNVSLNSTLTLNCVPPTSTVSANSTTTGATYSWAGPGIVSGGSTNTPLVNAPGTYTVTVTNPSNGCTNTSTITVSSPPPAIATVSADATIKVGDSTTLTASGGGTYLWFPTTDLSCANCSVTVATPNETTLYCVEVTNSYGCMDTACVKVTVEELCPYFVDVPIPNVFTPNTDGKNDLFFVEGWEPCIQTIATIIYDRWGLKIFETTNINIDWNGRTTKGVKVDDGTYYYLIDIKAANGEQKQFKGFINVLR